MTPPDALRTMLLLTLIGMTWLAIACLRRRHLPPLAFTLWGLLALLVPAIGPFLVILLTPRRR